MSYNQKKFLDINGLTHFIRVLDNYTSNEILDTVINAIQSSIDNVVIVSDTQPTASDNKIWIKPSVQNTVQVPTVQEMNDAIAAVDIPVQDVRINGSSVLSNRIANIPNAHAQRYGAVKTATEAEIQSGSLAAVVVSTSGQHRATFYGLAKAAGADMKDIANVTLGEYPDAQKGAIQKMLGVSDLIAPEENNLVASQAYQIGDIFTANGKLYKATAAIAADAAIIVEGAGANCVETSVGEGFVKFTDYATANIPGVVKVEAYDHGLYVSSQGVLRINRASNAAIKTGTDQWLPLTSNTTHISTFFGLSKVAGVDLANETVTLGTYPDTAKSAIRTMIGAAASGDIPNVPVEDVQVNGTSILNNGIANVPLATSSDVGVIKPGPTMQVYSSGAMDFRAVGASEVKAGTTYLRALTPERQHASVFYGLTKAAGVDMASSNNAIGTYTPEAKGAIQSMLGISDLIAPEENNLVASKAYAIGDIFTVNGKLYKAIAAIAMDAAIILDGANANCVEYNISDNLSDKVAKIEIDYAGISQYTYSTKFGGEFNVTTATTSGYSFPYARATVTGIPSKHKLHRVTVNGIEYILSPKLWFQTTTTDFKVYTYLGKLSLYVSNTTGVPGTIDDVPFLIFFDINNNSSIDIITQTAGTYTIKIEEMTPIQKELPKSLIYGDNYIPIEKNNNGGTYNGFSIGVNELKNTRGAIALGYTNVLSNEFTKALGEANEITGKYGIAIGVSNTVSGTQSVAIGTRNIASNTFAFAEGADTTASGSYSHSEGFESLASGVASHAEGYGTIAEAEGAHAEGVYSIASGSSSHAEGAYGTASGRASHTEGEGNTAAGASSHAEGLLTIANGAGTHVSGFYNQADTVYDAWTANTSYDVGDKVVYQNYGHECITANSDTTWTAAHWKNIYYSSDKSIIVGNGASESSRSNAYSLTWTGDGKYAGDVYVKCNNDSTGGTKLATENIIAVQDTQPTDTDTKIWLPETAETPVQIPTMDDMNTALAGKVGDIQINGTSIVNSGVANVPIANASQLGAVKVRQYSDGLFMDSGTVKLNIGNGSTVKAGNDTAAFSPISVGHYVAFYGLAKASGDTTQSASSNAVGTYTDNAKSSIRAMLGAVGSEDYATNTTPGIVQGSATYGVKINSNGILSIDGVTSAAVKAGTDSGHPITSNHNHEVAFYGLAKAAGDTTQSASSNAVGAYTNDAKVKIRNMIGALGVSNIGKYGTSVIEDTEDGNLYLQVDVQDVQVNGTSIVSNGIANIPYGDTSNYGVLKIAASSYGLELSTAATGSLLRVSPATSANIKTGSAAYKPLTPEHQHEVVFYGLAKAAGDTTQSASSNAVGTYTNEAKAAIKNMLEITGNVQTIPVEGTDPTIDAQSNCRYMCGEVNTISITPSLTGICNFVFTSGSSPAVLTLPSTVKMPEWFDITLLDTNRIYEISISDGIYGAVTSWVL